MLYMLFATQMPPPGHVERVIFVHPGNAQEVQAFAAQLIGVKPTVPYQIANLLQQPRPAQPSIYCRQIKPMPLTAGGGIGMSGAGDQGPNFGPRDIPGDLRGVRPDTPDQHQVVPSALGDRYGSVPPDLLGELI
jgi:hypothetical protein